MILVCWLRFPGPARDSKRSILRSEIEEEINIDLKSNAPEIVIDGKLSDKEPGIVRLSLTTDYFRPGYPDPVPGVTVILNDDAGNQEILADPVGTEVNASSDDLPGARIEERVAGGPAASRAVDPEDHVVANVHGIGVVRDGDPLRTQNRRVVPDPASTCPGLWMPEFGYTSRQVTSGVPSASASKR
jgi:hypothetical protein